MISLGLYTVSWRLSWPGGEFGRFWLRGNRNLVFRGLVVISIVPAKMSVSHASLLCGILGRHAAGANTYRSAKRSSSSMSGSAMIDRKFQAHKGMQRGAMSLEVGVSANSVDAVSLSNHD